MKESDMNSTSETNRDMTDSLTDEIIDRTELPPPDDSFFAGAGWRSIAVEFLRHPSEGEKLAPVPAEFI